MHYGSGQPRARNGVSASASEHDYPVKRGGGRRRSREVYAGPGKAAATWAIAIDHPPKTTPSHLNVRSCHTFTSPHWNSYDHEGRHVDAPTRHTDVSKSRDAQHQCNAPHVNY